MANTLENIMHVSPIKISEKEMILCRLICKYLCCIYCRIIPPVNIPKARDEKKGEY